MVELKLKEDVFIDKTNFGDIADERIKAYFESILKEAQEIVEVNAEIKKKNKEIEQRKKNDKNNRERFIPPKRKKEAVSITKFRGILSHTNKIYNAVMSNEKNEIKDNQLYDFAYFKVRLAYESGRDEEVKFFIEHLFLEGPIDKIINCESDTQKACFLLYTRYLESLIAYFVFYEDEYNSKIKEIYKNGGVK